MGGAHRLAHVYTFAHAKLRALYIIGIIITRARIRTYISVSGFEAAVEQTRSDYRGVGHDHVRTIIAESAFPVAYIWSLIEFWRV